MLTEDFNMFKKRSARFFMLEGGCGGIDQGAFIGFFVEEDAEFLYSAKWGYLVV